MNFLADEGVEREIVEALRNLGHAVLYILEMSPGFRDAEILILAETKHDLLASSVSLGVALLHAPSARCPSPLRRCLTHQYQHPFSALARLLPPLRAVFWCSEVPDVLSYPDDTARPKRKAPVSAVCVKDSRRFVILIYMHDIYARSRNLSLGTEPGEKMT